MSEAGGGVVRGAGGKGRQHDPEGTKRNIIDTAMRIFADQGLSGARIDEIAERTNCSKRMIYYYFGDKEGLYLRCLEEAYSVVRSGEVDLNLHDLDPLEALATLVRFTFEHHAGHADFIRMVMIENIHHGYYLDKSETIQKLNNTAITNLSNVYQLGVEKGMFRKGLEPLELHWHISALCFFNVSNRATFGKIFGEEMNTKKGQIKRREQIVEMVLGYVSARRENKLVRETGNTDI